MTYILKHVGMKRKYEIKGKSYVRDLATRLNKNKLHKSIFSLLLCYKVSLSFHTTHLTIHYYSLKNKLYKSFFLSFCDTKSFLNTSHNSLLFSQVKNVYLREKNLKHLLHLQFYVFIPSSANFPTSFLLHKLLCMVFIMLT